MRAGNAKHPTANRGPFTITDWLLYCKYILLVSSKGSSLSCLWMFLELRGGQRIFSVQWLEMSWKFPLLGLAALTGKDTQSLPKMPRPSPWSPACWPQLTPGRKCAPSIPLSSPLHRAALFSLAWLLYWWSAMPLACWPWLMCLPWATFINAVRVFEFRSWAFQKIQQCKFTVWKKLTVEQL